MAASDIAEILVKLMLAVNLYAMQVPLSGIDEERH